MWVCLNAFLEFSRGAAKGKSQPFMLAAQSLASILGKNKDTPNEEAVYDYVSLVDNFVPHADYLTINISSPNTVGLRELQGRAALEHLLSHVHQQRLMSQELHKKQCPHSCQTCARPDQLGIG